MKKIFLITLIFFLVRTNFALSQTMQYPVSVSGYDGIYILLSNQIPSSFNIERSEATKDKWEQIAVTNSTVTAEEFARNFEHYSQMFPDLLQPQNAELENIWVTIQRTKNVDSLYYYGNSPVIRLSLGISYFDSTAERNIQYKYRISKLDESRQSIETLFTNQTSFPLLPSFEKPRSFFVKSQNNFVLAEWSSKNFEGLSSFLVFRRTNAKGGFEKISVLKNISVKSDLPAGQSDSVLFIFQDRTVEANNFYHYFIVPIDLFGNRGSASDTIFTAAYDFFSIIIPMNIKVESIDSIAALKLSWLVPQEQPAVAIKIFRSEYYDSSYSLISELPLSASEYSDNNIKPMQKYFYYLQLAGPLGELSPTTARVFGFCQSSEVPIPPINVSAEPLENGVKLSWQNTESFTEGFWVYRSNGYDDSLKLISSLVKEEKPFTIFYDTTDLSGKLTYLYSIRSASTSHVLSEFSDTVAARPYTKTYSPSPTGLNASLVDSTVLVMWDDMTETDSSVMGYVILRRVISENSSANFEPLADSLLSFNQNSFIDKNINRGNKYEYQVIAIDMFGGVSDPAVSSVIDYSYQKPLPPAGLMITKSDGGIKLNWSESTEKSVIEYFIYRQTRKSEAEQIGSVKSGNELEFTDRAVISGELYFYSIVAKNKYGLESEASQIVSIRP